mmetsp:Transcript_40834/g.87688  ORF Transcript_40834/g.87688 Transcript_40834/m.87688 type:complete len:154 (+) Transcript_40834:1026-1487(+)
MTAVDRSPDQSLGLGHRSATVAALQGPRLRRVQLLLLAGRKMREKSQALLGRAEANQVVVTAVLAVAAVNGLPRTTELLAALIPIVRKSENIENIALPLEPARRKTEMRPNSGHRNRRPSNPQQNQKPLLASPRGRTFRVHRQWALWPAEEVV